MPQRRLVLSCRKYDTELNSKADQGLISHALAHVWADAIEISILREQYSVRDLPILTREILDSVLEQTDGGKFTFSGTMYQLVPLVSRHPRCEPRLTAVRINDSCYSVQFWGQSADVLLSSAGVPSLTS